MREASIFPRTLLSNSRKIVSQLKIIIREIWVGLGSIWPEMNYNCSYVYYCNINIFSASFYQSTTTIHYFLQLLCVRIVDSSVLIVSMVLFIQRTEEIRPIADVLCICILWTLNFTRKMREMLQLCEAFFLQKDQASTWITATKSFLLLQKKKTLCAWVNEAFDQKMNYNCSYVYYCNINIFSASFY